MRESRVDLTTWPPTLSRVNSSQSISCHFRQRSFLQQLLVFIKPLKAGLNENKTGFNGNNIKKNYPVLCIVWLFLSYSSCVVFLIAFCSYRSLVINSPYRAYPLSCLFLLYLQNNS
uniref:Uncharacterized protein n=1 Tax=Cacopsylla melanoneura TaxID=428564 RepID=A0A8D8ZAF0_9HEMI